MLRNSLCGLALAGSLLSGSAIFAQDASLSDGQILQVVQTVNKGEIADARVAMRKSKSPEVTSFAKQMIADHSKSERAIAELAEKAKIKLSNSDVALQLTNEAELGNKELESAAASDFDKQYARAQLKMHGEVATTLQAKLMPMAQSDAVKSVLSQTLSTVQEHQRAVQDLKGRVGT
jgi:putative membrane protein